MIKFLNELIVNYNLKIFFKRKFRLKKKNNENNILLEFNAFHSYHIPVSYFANYLADKYDSNLIGYFNYKLISSPLDESLINKVKWFIGNKLNLKNFSIFRSFGVKDIFKPVINKNIIDRAEKKFVDIKDKIKTKKDILNITINSVEIGDLIYDTYIKSKKKPTISIDNDFFILLCDFLKLYFFWDDYFKKKNIKAIIGVHSVYSYAIPLRIAINNNIPTYCVNFRKISKIDNKMRYQHGEYVEFKNTFKKIKNDIKTKGIELAKQKIRYRLSGTAGVKSDLITSETSSFGNKFLPSLIDKNSKKKKFVIFPHDFFDAIHAQGKNLFEDFYEWLEFLGKISKKTNYEWYIKNRPNFSGKFKIYQPQTENVINDFIKRYPHIVKLPNNYSHNQIVNEGIDCALTVYGSVGFEYALFNVPVINANANNTHSNYSFNFHPQNLDEYENLILNFKKEKLQIETSEIYEYYFMKHIYYTKNWLINDLEHFMKYVGDYSSINSYKFYDFWIKNVTQQKELEILRTIKNFIESKDRVINITHQN